MRRAPLLAAAVLAVVGALALSGCTPDALAEQYKSASGKNYIAGDGSVVEIAPDNRGKPIDFSGTTEHGKRVTSQKYLGHVLVVNFWYAACSPCRLEAPALEKMHKKYADDGVHFLGVNTHDQPATAISFEKEYGVTYPSVIDVDTGSVQLAFHGKVRPNATPTTLVLDAKGRVAARILGPVSEQVSTLDTLIRSTMAGH